MKDISQSTIRYCFLLFVLFIISHPESLAKRSSSYYKIVAEAGNGGTIYPKDTVYVESGKSQTFIFSPASGYTIDHVKVDDNVLEEICDTTTTYTFSKVIQNHTIRVEFRKKTYTLTYRACKNGTIDGDTDQTVQYGKNGDEVEAKADTGYVFLRWSDNRKDNPRIDENVTKDIVAIAYFQPEIQGKIAICPFEWTSYQLHNKLHGAESIIWEIAENNQVSARIRGAKNKPEVLIESMGHEPFDLKVTLVSQKGDEPTTGTITVKPVTPVNVPEQATVQLKGDRILFVDQSGDQLFTSFQWGYLSYDYADAALGYESSQSYYFFPEGLDLDNHYYWVETKVDNTHCSRRSFYNHPDDYIVDVPRVEPLEVLRVYPVPVLSGLLHIAWEAEDFEILELTMTNSSGQPILLLRKQSYSPVKSITLDPGNYPSGMYILTLRIDQQRYTRKIIIQ